MGEQIQFFWTG